MNKIFLMQPRQSGKTTKAIYTFLKDPENTIFVVHNSNTIEYIHDKVGKNIKNCISSKQFHNKIIGKQTPKTIILDEYMLFKNKDEIYKIVQVIQPENVYIFSTPDKLYDKKLIDFVKEHKHTTSYQDLLLKYENKLTENIEKQIYDLYYNFLTDNDTILIDGDFNRQTYLSGLEKPNQDWLSINPQCKQTESCSKSLSKKCICPKEQQHEILNNLKNISTIENDSEFINIVNDNFWDIVEKPKQDHHTFTEKDMLSFAEFYFTERFNETMSNSRKIKDIFEQFLKK